MSSPDEEPKPLPLEVDIPKEHLPEVLHVYDKESALLGNPVFSSSMASSRAAKLFSR
jgi:hypothetical protein